MTTAKHRERARELIDGWAWDAPDSSGDLLTVYVAEALAAAHAEGREEMREEAWQSIETAPKGGGAEMVTDPAYVKPPKILLRFGDEAVSVAYWDWYYAEGGSGCSDGFAWIEPCSSEPLNLHYSTPPTHWQPIPKDTGE